MSGVSYLGVKDVEALRGRLSRVMPVGWEYGLYFDGVGCYVVLERGGRGFWERLRGVCRGIGKDLSSGVFLVGWLDYGKYFSGGDLDLIRGVWGALDFGRYGVPQVRGSDRDVVVRDLYVRVGDFGRPYVGDTE